MDTTTDELLQPVDELVTNLLRYQPTQMVEFWVNLAAYLAVFAATPTPDRAAAVKPYLEKLQEWHFDPDMRETLLNVYFDESEPDWNALLDAIQERIAHPREFIIKPQLVTPAADPDAA